MKQKEVKICDAIPLHRPLIQEKARVIYGRVYAFHEKKTDS